MGNNPGESILDRTLYTTDDYLILDASKATSRASSFSHDPLLLQPSFVIDWHTTEAPRKLGEETPLWKLAYRGLLRPSEPLPDATWPFDPEASQRALLVRSKGKHYD